MIHRTAFIVLAVASGSWMAQALAQSQPAPDRIDRRQAEQQQRIDKGIKKGQLTRSEAERLRQGQQRIQDMEEQARADGVVTRKERQQIDRAQNQESRNITRESHDREKIGHENPRLPRRH